MKKFGVKIYYETFSYVEVEAENRDEAFDKALDKIDDMPEEDWADELMRNNTIVDREIDEIN